LGYVVIVSDGQTVDALTIVCGGSRRTPLLNNAAPCKAAILAEITFALFWDLGGVC